MDWLLNIIKILLRVPYHILINYTKIKQIKMSEWKNKVKRHTTESEDFFCATPGWGMSDGIIELINIIKKRRKEKKAKKAGVN